MTLSINQLYFLAIVVIVAQLAVTTTFLEEGSTWEALSVFGAVCCFLAVRRFAARQDGSPQAVRKADWRSFFFYNPLAPRPATPPSSFVTSSSAAVPLLRASESRQGGCRTEAVDSCGEVLRTTQDGRRRSAPEDATATRHIGQSSKTISRSALTPSASAKREQGASTEPNILITAVRKGRTWELPKLLDQSYARHCERHYEDFGSDKRVQLEVLNDVLTVLRTCSVVHQHQAALSAYDHSAHRLGSTTSSDLWSLLLYNAVEANSFERCKEFYDQLNEHVEPTNHDFVNMVRAFAHFQDRKGLEGLLESLRRRQVKFNPVTRSRVLNVCSTECAFDLVPPLMDDELFDEELNVMNYNCILKGYAKKGHLKQCLALRDKMLAKGIELTQMTFGILIDACVRAGEFTLAKSIFDDFLASGLEPNAVHYTTVIKGLVNAGRMPEVTSMIEEMERSPTAKPDVITYQQLVKAYVDHGDLNRALQILRTATEKGVKPDRIMFECVLQGCCAKPMSSTEVLGIFDTMVDTGLQPTRSTLAVLVKAFSVSGNWRVALDVLSRMETRFHIKPEAHLFAQLGLACLKADDPDAAKNVYEEMGKAVGLRAVNEGAMSMLLRDCVTLSLEEAKAMAFAPNPKGGGGSSRSTSPSRSRISSADSLTSSSSLPCGANNLPSCASRRLAQFIEVNALDDRCVRLLTTVEAAKAEWAMDEEFLVEVDSQRGTASAKVVATIHRARSAPVCWASYPTPEDFERRFDTFVRLNALPIPCAQALKELPAEQLKWLMDQEFLLESVEKAAKGLPSSKLGRWATSVLQRKVQSLIKQAKELPAGGAAVASMLEQFICVNRLDERCAASLRALPIADAAWVMDQEWLVSVDASRGTAAAKVIGLLNKLRSEHRM